MKWNLSRLKSRSMTAALAGMVFISGAQLFAPVSAQEDALPPGCRSCMNCHADFGGMGYTGSDDGSLCITCCVAP